MSTKALVVESRTGAGAGQQIIRLSGPLIRESVFRFEDVLRENNAPTTIVDLSAVPHIDSAGLGSIVMAHVSHQRKGRRLAFVGVQDRVAKLLVIAGLNPVLTIFDSVGSAEEALA
jgi:anti-anti-sigma factor